MQLTETFRALVDSLKHAPREYNPQGREKATMKLIPSVYTCKRRRFMAVFISSRQWFDNSLRRCAGRENMTACELSVQSTFSNIPHGLCELW
jgi:hypothetical protein